MKLDKIKRHQNLMASLDMITFKVERILCQILPLDYDVLTGAMMGSRLVTCIDKKVTYVTKQTGY